MESSGQSLTEVGTEGTVEGGQGMVCASDGCGIKKTNGYSGVKGGIAEKEKKQGREAVACTLRLLWYTMPAVPRAAAAH